LNCLIASVNILDNNNPKIIPKTVLERPFKDTFLAKISKITTAIAIKNPNTNPKKLLVKEYAEKENIKTNSTLNNHKLFIPPPV